MANIFKYIGQAIAYALFAVVVGFFATKPAYTYLEPGKACGQHSTHRNEEVLVFLAGRGCLHIGDSERLDVGAGKVAYIPPQTLHDVENNASEPLVYIFCVAPAGGQ